MYPQACTSQRFQTDEIINKFNTQYIYMCIYTKINIALAYFASNLVGSLDFTQLRLACTWVQNPLLTACFSVNLLLVFHFIIIILLKPLLTIIWALYVLVQQKWICPLYAVYSWRHLLCCHKQWLSVPCQIMWYWWSDLDWTCPCKWRCSNCLYELVVHMPFRPFLLYWGLGCCWRW